MKYTVNGYSQEALIKHDLDLADSLILRLFADMYSSNSSKIEYQILEYEVENEEGKERVLKKDKFMWITYDYLYSQIPLVGSKSTFIRKVGELIEKGFLKKQVTNLKKGKKGTFLYISFGIKFSELIEYETEDTSTQNDKGGYPKQIGGLPKLSRGATQNDKGGYPKWVDKDSSITDSSITDSSITDSSITDSSIKEKINKKEKRKNEIEDFINSIQKSEEYKNLLFEFVRYRKKIKKTLKTIKPIENLIRNFSDTQKLSEALEIMQEKEWQSIEPEWVENYKKSKLGVNNENNTGNNVKKKFNKHTDYEPDYTKGFDDWN